MKINKFTLLSIKFCFFLLISCNKSNFKYKFQDQKDLFQCAEVDMDLIKEAVYTFENYLLNNYNNSVPKTVRQGYYYYWKISASDKLPKLDSINSHVISVRDKLKQLENLWISNGKTTSINSSHPLMMCIGENVMDEELKANFNFLIKSKTFNNNVFLAPIGPLDERVRDDNAFNTYLALNTFYARIMDVDFDNLEHILDSLKTENEIEKNNFRLFNDDSLGRKPIRRNE